MDKEALLTLLSALKIEFGLLLIFALGLRFGLQARLGQFWRGRIWMGLLTLTALTLLVFIYVASSMDSATKRPLLTNVIQTFRNPHACV